MNRLLGGSDNLWWLLDQRWSCNFILSARIRGAIAINQLTNALAIVHRRHPLLAVKIVIDEHQQPRFQSEGVSAIPLLSCHWYFTKCLSCGCRTNTQSIYGWLCYIPTRLWSPLRSLRAQTSLTRRLRTLCICQCCLCGRPINSLVAWRFFQGAGAGAGATLMLAMVRDLFEGATARVQLSYISLVINIAPIIAPTIGVGILAIASWRGIYGVLAVGGLVLILAIALGLDESIKSLDINALKPHRLIGNYLRVLNNRVFIGYALVDALSFGCLFAYVAASSLVMIDILGISTTYGLIFASTGIGIVAGSFVSELLKNRGVPSPRLLGFGLVSSATSAITIVLVLMTGAAQLFTLHLLIINTFCYGLIAPNAIYHALQLVENIAGSAAAVIGFMEMLGGSFASLLISFLFDRHTVNVMSEVMALFAMAITYTQIQSSCKSNSCLKIA